MSKLFGILRAMNAYERALPTQAPAVTCQDCGTPRNSTWTCAMCGQSVCGQCIEGGTCGQCREAQP